MGCAGTFIFVYDARVLKMKWMRLVSPLSINNKILFGLIVFICILLLIWGAERQSRFVNTDMKKSDQAAYMFSAKQLKLTNYQVISDRARMPLYSYLMSIFFRETMSDQDFFEIGKRIGILIAIIVFLINILIFVKYVGVFFALVGNLLIAFTVFAYRAPYFKAEILFYGISFWLFVLIICLLILPIGIFFEKLYFS